jgi:hypothetical protein
MGFTVHGVEGLVPESEGDKAHWQDFRMLCERWVVGIESGARSCGAVF